MSDILLDYPTFYIIVDLCCLPQTASKIVPPRCSASMIVRLSQLIKSGVTAATVSRMRQRGLVRQLSRGLHQLAVAPVAAELLTAMVWLSAWPDLIVGLGIAAMNADAAREVWEAVHKEHQAAA
jgi:hypothetical protein